MFRSCWHPSPFEASRREGEAKRPFSLKPSGRGTGRAGTFPLTSSSLLVISSTLLVKVKAKSLAALPSLLCHPFLQTETDLQRPPCPQPHSITPTSSPSADSKRKEGEGKAPGPSRQQKALHSMYDLNCIDIIGRESQNHNITESQHHKITR